MKHFSNTPYRRCCNVRAGPGDGNANRGFPEVVLPVSSTASVADRIRRELQGLTPAERRVGRALLAGYPVSGLTTVAELAAESATSSATVVRLVQKLGFDGYPQFQSSLRDELATRTAGPADRIDQGDHAWSEPGVLGRTAMSAAAAVRGLSRSLPESEFDQAVGVLSDTSRPVHMLGGRVTGLLADYLHHHLSRGRRSVAMLPTGGRAGRAALLDVGRRDVVVAFDVRRYDPHIGAVCRILADRRATLVLVTDTFLSPIASYADVVLPVPVEAPSPFDTSVAALVVVEALATAVVARLGAGAVRRMHEWDRLDAVEPRSALPTQPRA
jgi:DNA-binding MurR/RpiR family transcriptional regulator